MQSKKWVMREKNYKRDDIRSMAKEFGLPPVVISLLSIRGVEDIKRFTEADIAKLYDPFLMKDVRLGVGLLIVFGVITVVREVIEPKIVGKSLGLSPILALISMYAGLKLFGFFGMIIVPAAVTLVCAAVGKERSSD